jgi:hypothetical protein
MAKSTPQPDVSPDEAARVLEEGIAGLDPQRAEALDGLKKLRAVRGAGYLRERERLALKYGAEDPRVAALGDKARFNVGLSRDLDFEIDRAKTEAPVADEKSYVFHGFVRDRKGAGVPRLTVALYDEKGNLLRAFGQACTDERGYFILRSSGTGTEPKERDTAVIAPGADAAAYQPRQSARLYVLDANGATLHVEKEPVVPQPGEVDFRIIILDDKAAPCGPAPDTKPTEPPRKSEDPKERPPVKRGAGARTAPARKKK